MNAPAQDPPKRMSRIFGGPFDGAELLTFFAPYWSVISNGVESCQYERWDPPTEVDGVWWHHYTPPRGKTK